MSVNETAHLKIIRMVLKYTMRVCTVSMNLLCLKVVHNAVSKLFSSPHCSNSVHFVYFGYWVCLSLIAHSTVIFTD
jgi:hypothetical protein